MSEDVKRAFPPLLVVVAGVVVAYLMLTSHFLWILLALVPAGVGWLSLDRARQRLKRDPVGSLKLFEVAQLLPYSVAVAVSSFLIFVAVWLEPPEAPQAVPGSPPPRPDPFAPYFGEMLKALAGGVSAFLTAAFIKSREEPDGWVASQVEAAFKEHFRGFPNDAEADRALKSADFNGHGWEPAGRKERAGVIAEALAGGS